MVENIGCLNAGSGVALWTYRGDPENPKSWAAPTFIESAPTLEEQFDIAWFSLGAAVRVVMAGRPLHVQRTTETGRDSHIRDRGTPSFFQRYAVAR